MQNNANHFMIFNFKLKDLYKIIKIKMIKKSEF